MAAMWIEEVGAPPPYVYDGLAPEDYPDGWDDDAWVDRVLAGAFAVFLAAVAVVVIAQVVMRVRGRG